MASPTKEHRKPPAKKVRPKLFPSSKYRCTLCNKDFVSPQPLQIHMANHTREKPFQCEQCDTSFAIAARLRRHVNEVHTKKITFTCEFRECGKVFTRKESLQKHSLLHDPDSEMNIKVTCPICKVKLEKRKIQHHIYLHSYREKQERQQCDICLMICRNSNALTKHKIIHLSAVERPVFPCNFCEKKLLTAYTLRAHIKSKHSEIRNQYPCTFCEKILKSSRTLNAHFRTHTGETPYPCDLCDMAFENRSKLKQHIIIVHKPETTHNCTQCSKRYVLKGEFKRHMLSHTDERNYECTSCPKKFNLKTILKRHMLSHMDERKFKCDICNKCFKTERAVKRHSVTHSESRRIYSCDKCSKTYRDKGALWQHTFTHSDKKLTCETCNQEFSTPLNLKRHVTNLHTVRKFRYKCSLCEKSFFTPHELNLHILGHTGEKPYPCTECPMRFVETAQLNKHFHRIHQDSRRN